MRQASSIFAALLMASVASCEEEETGMTQQPTEVEFLEAVEPYCELGATCAEADSMTCQVALTDKYRALDASKNCEVQPALDYYACLGVLSCSEFREVWFNENPNPADDACNEEKVAAMGCV